MNPILKQFLVLSCFILFTIPSFVACAQVSQQFIGQYRKAVLLFNKGQTESAIEIATTNCLPEIFTKNLIQSNRTEVFKVYKLIITACRSIDHDEDANNKLDELTKLTGASREAVQNELNRTSL